MIRTNRDRLIRQSVLGRVAPPGWRRPYRVGYDGVPRVVPGTGGITYNLRVGDLAMGWAADHVEPGVSSKDKDDDVANAAYNVMSCVGNDAFVVDGDAKGAKGTVVGKHGGIEHVMIDFEPEVLEKLVIGDKLQVRAFGQGLELPDFPGVKCMNVDPRVVEKLGTAGEDGKLAIPVTHIVPAELMGSGIGSASAERGDYDITTQDPELIKELGLDDLRLGDIVAVTDRSSFYGRQYRRGAVEILIVSHADSHLSGHGPGCTTLLTANNGEIKPVIDERANIAIILGLREDMK